MKRLLELLSLTLAMYGSVYPSAFALDRNFTYQCDDSMADMVATAISTWNKAAGQRFHATRVDRGADVVVVEVKEISGGFRGWTDIENDQTRIQIVRDCDHKDAVILHEFGHAFGLKHSQDRKSIMYYAAKAEATLSPEDEWKIRRK